MADPGALQDFRAAKRLFHGAREKSADDQEAFVRDATDDQELIAQVLELLAASGSKGPDIDEIVGRAAADVLARIKVSPPPKEPTPR